MNTTKEKQITINATEEAKAEFKLLKEQHDLTDKDMVHILIDTFKAADKEIIATVIAEFSEKKKDMVIEAKLARYARKMQLLRETLAESKTSGETSADEDVVYSAETEEEEVNA